MDLKKWIIDSGMTQKEFAVLVGLSDKHHLNRIVNQRITPSRKLALKIQKITNGEIKAGELLKII